VTVRRDQLAKTRVVLPVEGSAHNDDVNRSPRPDPSRFEKQLFDDFKGIRRTTGHRAHRVQLIDGRRDDLIVDVMPVNERILGFSNRSYPAAIETAQSLNIADMMSEWSHRRFSSRPNWKRFMDAAAMTSGPARPGEPGSARSPRGPPSPALHSMSRLVGSIEGGPSSIVAALMHLEAMSRVRTRRCSSVHTDNQRWPRLAKSTLDQVDDRNQSALSRRYPASIDSVPETHAESSLLLRHLRVG
jgi:hypothetical protein